MDVLEQFCESRIFGGGAGQVRGECYAIDPGFGNGWYVALLYFGLFSFVRIWSLMVPGIDIDWEYPKSMYLFGCF